MKPLNDRYARQLMLPELGEAGQRKLSNAKVLIVGVGGLGSPISIYLAGAGVGTLGLVDADVVSASNLQRQVLYSEAEVGLPKVSCAKKRLQALNSEVQINTYAEMLTADNAEAVISPYDVVVDGCDNFSTRYLINDTCVHLGKPYVYGTICGFDGQVSVFNHHTKKNYRTLFPNEAEMTSLRPSKAVLGVTPAIVGSVEASETIKLLCGIGQLLDGRLWTVNLLTMQTNILVL